MANLQLSLKKQWFEMTKSGVKTEDYREITPYWVKRLTQIEGECDLVYAADFLKKGKEYNDTMFGRQKHGFCFPKKFAYNVMTLSYPKNGDTERILKLEHKGIEIGYGKPEWGAEPNKFYFIIKHGAIL